MQGGMAARGETASLIQGRGIDEGDGMTQSSGPEANFERVKAQLKARLGNDVYSSWFGRMQLAEASRGLVRLSVPTAFLRQWINSHYVELISELWKQGDPSTLKVEIVVRSAARTVVQPVEERAPVRTPQRPAAPAAAAAAPAPGVEHTAKPAAPRAQAASQEPQGGKQSVLGSPLDARYTFESFVEGPSNRVALAAARAVAEFSQNALRFNPLFLHASVGLGKTHILQAIAAEAIRRRPQARVVYLTAEYFMWRFATAIRDNYALHLKEQLRDIDLLIIDDMQFLQGKSATEFGHTLGTLLTGAKQVVCAGDAPPRDLEMLDERVRSRLSGGLVVGINPLDLELRKAIVTRRAEQASARFADAHFTPSVIDYVARVVVSHGRDLDGAVNRLLAANQLTKEPITVQLAERTLADLVRARDTRRVRIEDILRIVSRHYKVPRNDLLSSRRSRDVVRPRQIAMYLAKSLTSRSLPEIGRRFGGRDHTTVLHSVRKVEQMIKDDGDLAQEIELLKRMLEE